MAHEESENAQEAAVEIQPSIDALPDFTDLFNTLVPEAPGEEAGESPAEDPASGTGEGLPAPEAEGAGGAGEAEAAQPAGDAGGATVAPPEQPATDVTDVPGIDASELAPKWGEISTALENRQRQELETEALAEIKEQHPKYFEALNKHPRELVGTEVPSITGEGMETIRDSSDAKDWQEGIKQVLYREIQELAARKADDVRPMMETVSNSIALFQQNPDLIPGTKQFNKELAESFTKLVKPYELRVDGKLMGYTIPVQQLVESVREQLKQQAAPAAPAAPPAPTPQQQRAAAQPRNEVGQFAGDQPQVGIPSTAGASGDEPEDFSTLFGTIGLPNIRI